MASKQHILLLPFMAQGHLIPFLALARQIQQKTNFTITIANTPLNIQNLHSTISNSSYSSDANINLVKIPFCPTNHGLPPGTENTDDLSVDHMEKFLSASLTIESPFRQLLQDMFHRGHPPTCIISDVFFGWAVNVAKSFNIPVFTFTTGGAYGTAAYMSIWMNLPHRLTDLEEFHPPGFPDKFCFSRSLLHRFLRAADGTDFWSKFYQSQISASLDSCGWLCNTVEEIEPLGVQVLRNLVNHPVWCIGPLLPPNVTIKNSSWNYGSIVSAQRAGKKPGISPEKCIKWLSSRKQSSVLYISFGSQNTISLSQMMQLAKGLEDSEQPFIWAIRPPLGFNIKGEFKAEWLPEGFEERITSRNQGLLVKKWAPQLEILSHKSTGAFLSHCGWNSILESLSQGVPIIGWPMAAEQNYNSKMLMEEMNVSIELTRGAESAPKAKEVKRAIELVMNEVRQGGLMKRKAAEIADLIREAVRDDDEKLGSSARNMDGFLSMCLIQFKNRLSTF